MAELFGQWFAKIIGLFVRRKESEVNFSDWYEELVGISVLVSSGRVKNPEAEVTARIYNLIKFLEDAKAKDSAGNLIIDKARGDYAENVKKRAGHHYGKATELRTEV